MPTFQLRSGVSVPRVLTLRIGLNALVLAFEDGATTHDVDESQAAYLRRLSILEEVA